MKMMGKVAFRLVRTDVFTRRPCDICSGETDGHALLCEANSPFSDHGTLHMCPKCLQLRNFDLRLEQRAQGLTSQATAVRSLIGRIEAPSYAEWKQALAPYDAANAEWEQSMRAAGRGDEVGEGEVLVWLDDRPLPF
jgi:hypothetical protein